MKRTDIKIIHLIYATIINTPNTFLSFDSVSGDKKESITCICSLRDPVKFLLDLETQKIVTIKHGSLYMSEGKTNYSSFTLIPGTFYTNQKLEDVIAHLFEKHNM